MESGLVSVVFMRPPRCLDIVRPLPPRSKSKSSFFMFDPHLKSPLSGPCCLVNIVYVTAHTTALASGHCSDYDHTRHTALSMDL